MAEPASHPGGRADASTEFTEDAILGGQVRLRQPRHGYRVAIDTVFLAAAVPAGDGEMVVDVGSGIGAASLCLARRVRGCRISGIEPQTDLVRLAGENVSLNNLTGRVDIMVGSLDRPPMRLAPSSFHHAMANPPYLEAARVRASPNPAKAAANVEAAATADGASGAGLGDWLHFCLAMVRHKGTVTIIHRADRLDDVLAGFKGVAGGVVVYPLWPDAKGTPAKRVLVRAVKGASSPMRLTPGLVLHTEDGAFTPAADAVLRDAAAVNL
ncbi:MAG: methyltransferase [Alphaproteobacteria bacterium]